MKISPAIADSAPVVLVFGPEGRGKTTLASKFPKPLGLLLERGLPRGMTMDAVENIKSYDDAITTLRELIEDSRGYETLVIDTLDALEPAISSASWLKTCASLLTTVVSVSAFTPQVPIGDFFSLRAVLPSPRRTGSRCRRRLRYRPTFRSAN